MNENNKEENILDKINNQILSFDNKASILISAIGIVFALSLTFFDVIFEKDFLEKCKNLKLFYKILFVLFIINGIIAIFLYIAVIIPRKKIGNNKYANYYNDIAKLNIENYKEYNEILNDYTKDNHLVIEQIIINSKICKTKHLFLKSGIISLIPFAILFLLLIIFPLFFNC